MSGETDDARLQAIAKALEAARAQASAAQKLVQELERALGQGEPAVLQEEQDWIPVKVAAEIWGVTDNCALKRARRGDGIARKGADDRWYFPRAFVEAEPRQDAARRRQDAAR